MNHALNNTTDRTRIPINSINLLQLELKLLPSVAMSLHDTLNHIYSLYKYKVDLINRNSLAIK